MSHATSNVAPKTDWLDFKRLSSVIKKNYVGADLGGLRFFPSRFNVSHHPWPTIKELSEQRLCKLTAAHWKGWIDWRVHKRTGANLKWRRLSVLSLTHPSSIRRPSWSIAVAGIPSHCRGTGSPCWRTRRIGNHLELIETLWCIWYSIFFSIFYLKFEWN